MASAEQELLAVLLGRIFQQGLIPERTYEAVRDALAAAGDLPRLFQDTQGRAEEGQADGCAQDPG